MVKASGARWLILGLLLAPAGCVTERERDRPLPLPRPMSLTPATVAAGRPFNVQPDGVSALSVVGENLYRGCRVRLAGEALETHGGYDWRSLAAIVPARLTARPGVYAVTVVLGDGTESAPLFLNVVPAEGPAPVIAETHPESAPAGVVFNPQPGGAALSVTGRNFVPGAVVSFAGERLVTVYGGPDRLSALVPVHQLKSPGAREVRVINPDGRRSPPVRFNISGAAR